MDSKNEAQKSIDAQKSISDLKEAFLSVLALNDGMDLTTIVREFCIYYENEKWISVGFADTLLRIFEKQGLVERIGEGRGSYWKLTDAEAYINIRNKKTFH